jgi:hypothetical protein
MRGAIPPLPNTPSWRGAQIKALEQLYFYVLFIYIGYIDSHDRMSIND